eukprot:scaffold249275_cov15-Tisochrysis_lutea.AAC.1
MTYRTINELHFMLPPTLGTGLIHNFCANLALKKLSIAPLSTEAAVQYAHKLVATRCTIQNK